MSLKFKSFEENFAEIKNYANKTNFGLFDKMKIKTGTLEAGFRGLAILPTDSSLLNLHFFCLYKESKKKKRIKTMKTNLKPENSCFRIRGY